MKHTVAGLQLGNFTLGEQEINGGTYEKLKSVGTLHAQNASFHDLSILGDATLKQCDIVKLSISGEATVYDGQLDFVEVLGQLSLRGKVSCGGIRVLGDVESEDTICRILQFGSASYFRIKRKKRSTMAIGKFQAETLQNFFPIQLNGKQHFKTIINSGQIVSSAPISCERFMSFGPCDISEINSEMMYLYPSSSVTIDTLQGGVIVIDEQFDHEQWLDGVAMDVSAKEIQTTIGRGSVHIKHMEADEVVVNHIVCKHISANRVVIGEHANVECVEYMDTCEIHPSAKVKKVVKL